MIKFITNANEELFRFRACWLIGLLVGLCLSVNKTTQSCGWMFMKSLGIGRGKPLNKEQSISFGVICILI